MTLADIDRRTRAFQAAERLLDGLLRDLGGEDRVSVGERELAQRAAVLGAMIGDAEARWLRGEPVELTDYLASVKAHRRVLATLGLERRARDVNSDLRGRQRGCIEVRAHTGTGGCPVRIAPDVGLSKLSVDELITMRAILEKAADSGADRPGAGGA